MSTFNLKVHELLGLHPSADRESSRDSKGRMTSSPQDLSMVETANSIAEFAVAAQMQGCGIDRKTAIQLLRGALEAVSAEGD